jgi:hypothetical protein
MFNKTITNNTTNNITNHTTVYICCDPEHIAAVSQAVQNAAVATDPTQTNDQTRICTTTNYSDTNVSVD